MGEKKYEEVHYSHISLYIISSHPGEMGGACCTQCKWIYAKFWYENLRSPLVDLEIRSNTNLTNLDGRVWLKICQRGNTPLRSIKHSEFFD